MSDLKLLDFPSDTDSKSLDVEIAELVETRGYAISHIKVGRVHIYNDFGQCVGVQLDVDVSALKQE